MAKASAGDVLRYSGLMLMVIVSLGLPDLFVSRVTRAMSGVRGAARLLTLRYRRHLSVVLRGIAAVAVPSVYTSHICGNKYLKVIRCAARARSANERRLDINGRRRQAARVVAADRHAGGLSAMVALKGPE